jgi:rare lipoprotein A
LRKLRVAIVAVSCVVPFSTAFSSQYAEYLLKASYYSSGKVTASGERFNKHGYTAASKTLPFGTRLHVSNPATGRSVIVRINDRGPFIKGRDLDLAQGAAHALGMIEQGVAVLKVVHLPMTATAGY